MARSGGLSHHCRSMLLYGMFGQSSGTDLSPPPSGWFGMALFPVDPYSSGYRQAEPVAVDTSGAETGYARVEVPLGAGSGAWMPSGLSGIVNASEIRFPVATGEWGQLRYWMMLDAQSGGRVLAYGELPYALLVRAGGHVMIAPGGIQISLDSYDTEW